MNTEKISDVSEVKGTEPQIDPLFEYLKQWEISNLNKSTLILPVAGAVAGLGLGSGLFSRDRQISKRAFLNAFTGALGGGFVGLMASTLLINPDITRAVVEAAGDDEYFIFHGISKPFVNDDGSYNKPPPPPEKCKELFDKLTNQFSHEPGTTWGEVAAINPHVIKPTHPYLIFEGKEMPWQEAVKYLTHCDGYTVKWPREEIDKPVLVFKNK
jgi:hypothetical protein